MSWCARALRRFSGDCNGSIAITFAVVFLVILMVAGAAIDYSRAVTFRGNLQSAADAAALAAAQLDEKSSETKIAAARAVFKANGKSTAKGLKDTVVKVTNDGVTVLASAQVPTSLLNAVGIQSIRVSVKSIAESSTIPVDIYLLLDMSASMGLAASADDRQRMMALSKPWILASNTSFKTSHPHGCTFACHQREGYEPGTANSYDLARKAGISLREDIVQDAATSFIDTVLDPASSAVQSNKLKVGIIGFSNSARWLTKPTSDYNVAKAAITRFPIKDRQDTHLEDALKWLDSNSHAESQDRRRVIILVTDGVSGGRSPNYSWSALKSSACAPLKSNKTDLYVLDVTYEEQAGDSFFETYVRPFFPRIQPALSSCASTGKYQKASEPDAIATQFDALAKSLKTLPTRLTH